MKTLMQAMTLLSMTFLLGCSNQSAEKTTTLSPEKNTQLYSMIGKEHKVQFKAVYRSSFRNLEDVWPQTLPREIRATTQFLFGPLTHRELGGIQKGEKIQTLMDKAYMQNGRVMVPYLYQATWIIESEAVQPGLLNLPIPYSIESLRTPNWQSCTDNGDEEHRTWSFLWYFWDPTRRGCEHKENEQYQMVQIQIGEETNQTQESYPEYRRMIRDENGVPTLSMTLAFGYVKDAQQPDPFRDMDYGAREFQKFHRFTRGMLLSQGFQESPIYQRDITVGNTVIGTQFVGMKNGLRHRVSIVAAAGVDQMDIFAHSFAKKHEGFFAWFGHSRVGSGFDAEILRYKLATSPQEFSISPEYQMIYWAGCNSYSYYTLPFFDMKARLQPQADPQGTRNLDLISNALPSLFAFNAANAQIVLEAMLNSQTPMSYQTIIDRIERHGRSWGVDVIVNVLGDEDNQLPQ